MDLFDKIIQKFQFNCIYKHPETTPPNSTLVLLFIMLNVVTHNSLKFLAFLLLLCHPSQPTTKRIYDLILRILFM